MINTTQSLIELCALVEQTNITPIFLCFILYNGNESRLVKLNQLKKKFFMKISKLMVLETQPKVLLKKRKNR
jgi:hypothetical protein